MFKMAIDEKDIEKITEHLYRWKDPARLRKDPYIFVHNDSANNYNATTFITNDILRRGYGLSDDEIDIVQLTRDLKTDMDKNPQQIDPILKDYNDRVNAYVESRKAGNVHNVQGGQGVTGPPQEKERSPVSVVSAEAMGQFLGIPPGMANLFFAMFRDEKTGIQRPYPTEVAMLYLDGKKGYSRIVVTPREISPNNWETVCEIYPKVTVELLEAFIKLPHEYQAKLFDQIFGPTVEVGRANPDNVRNPRMMVWMREMSIARAVNRCSRLYSGYGGTTAEELPEGEVNPEEVGKGIIIK